MTDYLCPICNGALEKLDDSLMAPFYCDYCNQYFTEDTVVNYYLYDINLVPKEEEEKYED